MSADARCSVTLAHTFFWMKFLIRSNNCSISLFSCFIGLSLRVQRFQLFHSSTLSHFFLSPSLTYFPPHIKEGNWAFPASPEARVLRETGHEGHPHRPANDLHASHRLHGQLHEKVSRPSSLKSSLRLPKWRLISMFPYSILPFEAIVCMYRFLGADKCMYPFLAQRKEAMNNNEAKNGI